MITTTTKYGGLPTDAVTRLRTKFRGMGLSDLIAYRAGIEDRIRSLTANAYANLVTLDADALTDIGNDLFTAARMTRRLAFCLDELAERGEK